MISALLCRLGIHVKPSGFNPRLCIAWSCQRDGCGHVERSRVRRAL